MIDVMIIFIVSCIALSVSVYACALWWEAGKRIDELERGMASMNQRVLMAETVIRRIDKRLEDGHGND